MKQKRRNFGDIIEEEIVRSSPKNSKGVHLDTLSNLYEHSKEYIAQLAEERGYQLRTNKKGDHYYFRATAAQIAQYKITYHIRPPIT